MPPSLYTAASPLLLLGVPLVLFADRNLDHQRQNMREGKEYVWQEKFRPTIGNLIHELDQDVELALELETLKSRLNDDSVTDPDDIDTVEDIPRKVIQDAPFTKTLREVTDTIGTHSEQITKLEQHYQDLEGHLRYLGVSFLVGYAVLAGGQFRYGPNVPIWVFIVFLLVLGLGSHQAWRYISKKRELRSYADQYENTREI